MPTALKASQVDAIEDAFEAAGLVFTNGEEPEVKFQAARSSGVASARDLGRAYVAGENGRSALGQRRSAGGSLASDPAPLKNSGFRTTIPKVGSPPPGWNSGPTRPNANRPLEVIALYEAFGPRIGLVRARPSLLQEPSVRAGCMRHSTRRKRAPL